MSSVALPKALQWLTPEHILLAYASGGAGKSTLLAHLAAYVWKKYGKKTRVVGADGGGTKPFQILIEKGIVEYWPIDLWDKDIWTVFDLATKGWWPSDLKIPNSKLLPPYREHWLCPHCHHRTKGVGTCDACKKTIPAGMLAEKELEPMHGFENVGAYGFESIAAWTFLIMDRLRVVAKPEDAFAITDSDSTQLIKQSAQNHYGIAQNYIQKWVGNTRRLPVWAVMWTTLELRGGDDGYGKPVYGPALPGKKLTALCTPWFTDVIHLELEAKDDEWVCYDSTCPGTVKATVRGVDAVPTCPKCKGPVNPRVDRVLYLADHYPPDTKPFSFKAKTSVPGMPVRMAAPRAGNTMTEYFRLVEEAYARQEKQLLG